MAELDARRTEVLSSAAQTMQRRIRTHIAQKQFIETRKASAVIQSFCRGKTVDYLSLNLRGGKMGRNVSFQAVSN